MKLRHIITRTDAFFIEKPFSSTIAVLGLFFSILYSSVIFLGLDTLESVLGNHWQTADIEVLRKDPIAALLHLHSQPPLFNFLYWLLDTLPGRAYDYFVIINCLAQSIVALIVVKISSQILKSPTGGFGMGIFYLISPATLLYATYAFYPPLTSMGFAILVYGFFILHSRTRLASILIVSAVCYLYLIRSSFSLPAGIILLSIFIYQARNYVSKQFLLTTVSACLLIMLALPMKNYLLYGFFSSSSWTPLNAIMALGIKTPLGPFATPTEIKKAYPELECKRSYGLLDTEDKKTNGEPNYNSCYFIAYLNQQMPNVASEFSVFKYLRNIKRNMGAYFDTPDGYFFLTNRDKIDSYAFAYNFSFLTAYFKFHQIRIGCILLVLYLIYRVKKQKEYLPAILLTILTLHFFAHTLTDGQESRRHVFDVEFIFYLIYSILLSSLYQKWLHKHELKKLVKA
jgi:hypothetical protein